MSSIDYNALKKTRDDVKTLIPDGDQPMIVVESEATTAKESGNPMIKLKLSVREGQFKGRNLFTNIVIVADNGWALDRFFKNLEAFGIGDAELATSPSVEQLAYMMKDKNVIGVVDHHEWKGEDRNGIAELKKDGVTSMLSSNSLSDFSSETNFNSEF